MNGCRGAGLRAPCRRPAACKGPRQPRALLPPRAEVAAATAPHAEAAAATGKVGGRVVSSSPTPSLGAGYIECHVWEPKSRERFPRGWSTCRGLGEGPGFTGPLVEPHPRRRSRYSRGRSPALTEPTPRRPRGAGGGRGGRLGRCAGGAGPRGPRREGGRAARRQEGSGLGGSVPCGRPRPSAGALGARAARRGGARRGWQRRRAARGPRGLTWEPRLATRMEGDRRLGASGGGLLGPWGYS